MVETETLMKLLTKGESLNSLTTMDAFEATECKILVELYSRYYEKILQFNINCK